MPRMAPRSGRVGPLARSGWTLPLVVRSATAMAAAAVVAVAAIMATAVETLAVVEVAVVVEAAAAPTRPTGAALETSKARRPRSRRGVAGRTSIMRLYEGQSVGI